MAYTKDMVNGFVLLVQCVQCVQCDDVTEHGAVWFSIERTLMGGVLLDSLDGSGRTELPLLVSSRHGRQLCYLLFMLASVFANSIDTVFITYRMHAKAVAVVVDTDTAPYYPILHHTL